MAIGDPWDTSYDPRENGISQYDWMLKQNQFGIHNNWTRRVQWGPDHSYLVPQSDSPFAYGDALNDRRGGRFCTQGCGCVDIGTTHPFKEGISTILPHELGITVWKADAGETRRHLAEKYHENIDQNSNNDNKLQIVLKYSNGAWRGRKPCLKISDFDSCRYTTSRSDSYGEYSKPSDCHFANSRFAYQDEHNPNDHLDPIDFHEFAGSIDDRGVWNFSRVGHPNRQYAGTKGPKGLRAGETITPRYIEDHYVKVQLGGDGQPQTPPQITLEGEISDAWREELEGSDGKKFNHRYTIHPICRELPRGADRKKYVANPLPQFGNKQDCEASGIGYWTDKEDEYLKASHNLYYNYFDKENIDTADVARLDRVSVAEDGYVRTRVGNGYTNDGSRSDQFLNYEPDGTIPCVADGFTPIIKRPHCKDPIVGLRIPQECESLEKDTNGNVKFKSIKDCTDHGTCDVLQGGVTEKECTDADPNGKWTAYKWLYGDEESCIATGVCEYPNDVINTRQKRSEKKIPPRCENAAGIPKLAANEKECEANGNIWVFADQTTCEARHGIRDAYCSDATKTTKEKCEEADETWNANRFISNDWEDSEYEKYSCCGDHMIDQNHPSRTPQFSGSKTSVSGLQVKDSNLENTTCFTPYEEYVLMPPDVPATNQFDRTPRHQKELKNKYNTSWTLLIRPCRFWKNCFDEGFFHGDNKDGGRCKTSTNPDIYDWSISNEKDCGVDEEGNSKWVTDANSFMTGCGEEIVLKIPTNQMLNDSNFNLTLSDSNSKKGFDLEKGPTKRDMSLPARNTYWRETQPSWDLKFGIFDKVYEWWNEQPDTPYLTPVSFLSGPFPADAMYDYVYDWWCRHPDGNADGIADGASGYDKSSQKEFCTGFVYSHGNYSSSGSSARDYSNTKNSKGAETFSKFNLQPQPFKATGERQLRAKTIEDAKVDYTYWFNCVSRAWAGDPGHWFANYGQDYFLYFDFEKKAGELAYEAYCNSISNQFNIWVKSHIGFLTKGTCTKSLGAIGWTDDIHNDVDGDHPCGFPYSRVTVGNTIERGWGCEAFDGSKSSCEVAGYCLYKDGTFDNSASEQSCIQSGGAWNKCCEYYEECTGPDGVIPALLRIGIDDFAIPIMNGPAKNRKECEASLETYSKNRSASNPAGTFPPEYGAGGEWREGCRSILEPTSCNSIRGIPDDLADIVFGKQHGDCINGGVSTPSDKESCNGIFIADTIGSASSLYNKRIGPYIQPAENIGSLPLGYSDPHSIFDIKDGVQTTSASGGTVNQTVEDAKLAEEGNSPDYWQDTGQYPVGDSQISFINDSCVGTQGSGRVQFASNEKPIKITSSSHNLADGDKVDIRDVLGNFAANVMTAGEWQETQWEEKKYNQCGKDCDIIINPSAICPHESNGTCDTGKYYACDGVVVAGKDPDPAPFFIAKNVTADTFELYTCDKKPVDGTTDKCYGEEQKVQLEWYSVYAHMDNIAVTLTTLVDSSTVLGTVSDIGSQNTGWNYLHFAIGEPTSDPQPLKLFAGGAVNGISFDTGFSKRKCLTNNPNKPRSKTNTKLLSGKQLKEIKSLISFDSLLESPESGYIWIEGNYSNHTDEAYYALDFSSHDATNCNAASLFSLSANGKGKKVYNPFPDSDANGNQIITEVVSIDKNVGTVVLKHHLPNQGPEVGSRAVSVWNTCPFTGKWETYQGLISPEEEAACAMDSECVLHYRPGFSGIAQKWKYRANDYYVSIEQKGVCPVCNDHYIPENLTATLSTVSSEYLNIANCTINPCYEPNVCIDNTSKGSKGIDDFDILYGVRDFFCVETGKTIQVDKNQTDCMADPDYEWKQDAAVAKQKCESDKNIWIGEDWWNYSKAEGYCCEDAYHPCDLGQPIERDSGLQWSEIEECEEDPSSFGRCEGTVTPGVVGTIFPHRPQSCADNGGTFTALQSKDQCDRFLRRRITINGTTNCRRCADVFTNENGVPLRDKVDARSGYYDSNGVWVNNTRFTSTTPLDKNGNNCCSSGKDSCGEANPSCECITNMDKYPSCTMFEYKHGLCQAGNTGVKWFGELKGNCIETIDASICSNQQAEFKWTPAGDGSGMWTQENSCSSALGCMDPTPPTAPPASPLSPAFLYITCLGSETTYHWEFDPCGCFENHLPASCECEKMYAGKDVFGQESCKEQMIDSVWHNPTLAREDKDGYYHHNPNGSCCGSFGDTLDTAPNAVCYNQAVAHQPITSTCPGLTVKSGDGNLLDVPMEYDGEVWKSEWTLMNEVGTKQCSLEDSDPTNCEDKVFPRNANRTAFGSDCKPPPHMNSSAKYLVFTNADCDGCDMPQYEYAGVKNSGGYRDAREPSTPKDGHFIRLVLGCGNAISSILPETNGELSDGGLGPSPSTYQSDSMKLWAEITNCNFHIAETDGQLKTLRIDYGVLGNPPCQTNSGCDTWPHFGKSIAEGVPQQAREFMFAGKCLSYATCGPKGPCVTAGCCTYEGSDRQFFDENHTALWNGSVACSTGGAINHICQTVGFEMGPDKRSEILTVHDIIDVNHLTGEGTLVAKSQGGTCSYAAGTSVSIGMAGPTEAESSSRDDYTRNKHAANPFLRGTVLAESIRTPKLPKEDANGYTTYTRGNRAGEFIFVKVNDITPLINKDSRKDRHLKYNDIRYVAVDEDLNETLKPIDEDGKVVNANSIELIVNEQEFNRIAQYPLKSAKSTGLASDLSGSQMVANKKLKYPYGNNPYPVATQTMSGTAKSQMWPKGKTMSPDNLESLRFSGSDRQDDIISPGRTGKLWRDYSPFTPVHSIVDSSFFGKKKDTAINSYENIYSPSIGVCLDNRNYKTITECIANNHIWVPQFLNTVIGVEIDPTAGPHEDSKNPNPPHEKIMISGTIAYKATCKGSRMGYCYKADGSGKQKDVNKCADVNEFTDGIAGKWIQAFEDADADKYICETVFNGKWVIGIRNDTIVQGKYEDPDNLKPNDLQDREKDFESGCPPACQLKGFYTEQACVAYQHGDSQGECYECIGDISFDEDEDDFIKCPLTPIDGNHVLVKKDFKTYLDTIYLGGPQDRNLLSYVESFREKILDNKLDYYALADEEHITVNDEAKVWKASSNMSVLETEGKRGQRSQANKTHLFDPSQPRSDYEELPKDECDSLTDGYYLHRVAYDSGNETTLDDTVAAEPSHLPICMNLNRFESHFLRGDLEVGGLAFYGDNEKQLQLEQLISGSTIFSTQGYYDFLGNRFEIGATPSTVTGPAGVHSYTQLTEACELSDVCHFEKVAFECRGGNVNDLGHCKLFTGKEDFVKTFPTVTQTKRKDCPSGSIFTPHISSEVDVYIKGLLERHQEKECLEAEHEVIPMFLCYKLDTDKLENAKEGDKISKYGEFLETGKGGLTEEKMILTPQECEAAEGKVFYDGIFNTASRRRGDLITSIRYMETYKISKDTDYFGDPLSKYKSRDFLLKNLDDAKVSDSLYQNEFGKTTYDLGLSVTDTGIAPPKRKWKGLIYANEVLANPHMSQKDKEDYSKYIAPTKDMPTGKYVNFYNGGRAYWSRHGGAFDITIGQKLPENKSRDNNSDKPVNLEFWLRFPQICCNLRGPTNYWACKDECWPHAGSLNGPILDWLQKNYKIDGDSLIHVNITEALDSYGVPKPVIGGGGERKRS